ncbi:thioredoxin family protein [Ulvibacter antarcticus]|uniref:Thiol-disulfide isomerase/thioredoxin n=1 Tax=Ulvibacter antarcticus TaxID=442714 RepID=A0A3L9Y907_9FLAO|nr:tetratricopeptide repeat protein [Ulvibacter antarcticus]RMA57183.1 thiol-disulfide isomerase/thioredoxin [Ulvibacter antarcticus]
MKNLILLIFTLSATILSYGQTFNHEIQLEGKPSLLLGKVNKDILSEQNYKDWFLTNAENYNPNQEKIAQIETLLSDYTITAFFGTWCGDSKEELPRFYKILEEADFSLDRLTVVAVASERDFYKQSPGGEEEGLNIHRVPTFIFYKDGKEVNRIVEHPVNSLETDILHILQQQSYTPNYHAVTIVNTAIEDMGLKKFQKKSKKLLPKLKKVAKNMYELNTYSSVLYFSDKKEEAIAVARLNTILFPKEATTYENLGHKLYGINRLDEALKHYETALNLDPTKEKIKDRIDLIKSRA